MRLNRKEKIVVKIILAMAMMACFYPGAWQCVHTSKRSRDLFCPSRQRGQFAPAQVHGWGLEPGRLSKAPGLFQCRPGREGLLRSGYPCPQDAAGKCVYCSHCQPCPAGLNVGLINKHYDLARAGDQLARRHYEKLEKRAGDCMKCGHCDRRCPFHVPQSHRMEEIQDDFGS